MSDSLGLITPATSARSIAIVSELVARGVSLSELDNNRRKLMRKSTQLVKYKGELLQRIEYFHDNQIATVTIPWDEIKKYSPEYNPSMLVIDDMRQTVGTDARRCSSRGCSRAARKRASGDRLLCCATPFGCCAAK